MFWELIATAVAGFAAAGVALSLRLVVKKLPRWIVPVAAGLGMMAFQIHSEYSWFEHTTSRLPADTQVVASVETPAFYKPWSYYRAPILHFVAVDTASVAAGDTPDVKRAQLYFFERRQAAQHLPVLVDCQNGLQGDLTSGAVQWGKTAYTDKLVAVVCQ
ncbi:hypothetical protein B0181_03665 [Moraxella caviae]|uniref:Uncharacterized protein n=1 Tax=Moraxella caviae TaxID=34060 RepID=A0A1T0A5H6_9GAMM|nr:hypothetical protein [Moraxella caviae]OOR91042.1 hypothetical protein B0181_03665 [Moraxella caviae]STZ14267.1 Uncharacterised protein [Moraxella caviae]